MNQGLEDLEKNSWILFWVQMIGFMEKTLLKK